MAENENGGLFDAEGRLTAFTSTIETRDRERLRREIDRQSADLLAGERYVSDLINNCSATYDRCLADGDESEATKALGDLVKLNFDFIDAIPEIGQRWASWRHHQSRTKDELRAVDLHKLSRPLHALSTVESIETVHARCIARDDATEAVGALRGLLDLIREYPEVGRVCTFSRPVAREILGRQLDDALAPDVNDEAAE